MNMGLCYFNWLSIQLSVCVAGLLECERAGEKRVRGKRGNPTCVPVSEQNGGTLCAEKYFSSEHHEGDSLSFC